MTRYGPHEFWATVWFLIGASQFADAFHSFTRKFWPSNVRLRNDIHKSLRYKNSIPSSLSRMASHNEMELLGTNSIPPYKLPLKVLLIDNYDSYTYNLYQYLSQMVETVIVVPNDVVDVSSDFNSTWSNVVEYLKLHHSLPQVDGIVLSPGPGSPCISKDVGICSAAVLSNPRLPILGVCLGHQLLGHLYQGAHVSFASEPMHGRITRVLWAHDSTEETAASQVLFGNTLSMNVTRYHSLAVKIDHDALQNNNKFSNVVPLAYSGNELMALAIRNRPHLGVQFHPESVGTTFGKQLLWNWCHFIQNPKTFSNSFDWRNMISHSPPQIHSIVQKSSLFKSKKELSKTNTNSTSQYEILVYRIDNIGDVLTSNDVHQALYSNQDSSVWLDSSRNDCPNSRFSVMAGTSDGGALSHLVEYFVDEQLVNKIGPTGVAVSYDSDILSYLQHALFESPEMNNPKVTLLDDSYAPTRSSESLPFEFRGGYVGYLAYEVRHDSTRMLKECRAENTFNYKLPSQTSRIKENARHGSVPDAAFLFADRSMVFDHHTGSIYLLGYSANKAENTHKASDFWPLADSHKIVIQWMKETQHLLENLVQQKHTKPSKREVDSSVPLAPSSQQQNKYQPNYMPSFIPRRSKDTYLQNIAMCHEFIRQGESYELCLTNHFILDTGMKHSHMEATPAPKVDPYELYQELRRANPAPFAAFLRIDPNRALRRQETSALVPKNPTSASASVALCSSSPERFLSLSSTGVLESKPIKGTCRRGLTPEEDHLLAQELAHSEKNSAENLMIVDLVRNDFGRVCEVGSVTVPKLCAIESYQTVHQLVSTVQGQLKSDCTAIDALVAAFPGGSMTGAPKLRTLDLLDELEEGAPRGAYSGCLGFISPTNVMDMNIVIRTAVVTPSTTSDEGIQISVGAGGAITYLSDLEDEYDEMVLKTNVVDKAVTKVIKREMARITPDSLIGESNSIVGTWIGERNLTQVALI